MKERGFIRTTLAALLVALVSFFIIYFFVPSMSLHYFDVAFSMREGSINSAVFKEAQSQGYSQENPWYLIRHLSSSDGQREAKRAWEQGGDAFKHFVSALLTSFP